MKNRISQVNWAVVGDLERVIEPLVSYISASDQPKAALMSAVAVLVSELERTNRAARSHVLSLLGNR